MTKIDNLTLRQHRFRDAYLGVANGDGVMAARLAGYRGDQNVLAVTASRLLRNAKVAESMKAHVTKAAMSATEVLQELTRIALSNSKHKIRALELLGKHHRLFTDRLESENQYKVPTSELNELAAQLCDAFSGTARFPGPGLHWLKVV